MSNISKNVGSQTLSVSIDFHYIFDHTMQINGNQSSLPTIFTI